MKKFIRKEETSNLYQVGNGFLFPMISMNLGWRENWILYLSPFCQALPLPLPLPILPPRIQIFNPLHLKLSQFPPHHSQRLPPPPPPPLLRFLPLRPLPLPSRFFLTLVTWTPPLVKGIQIWMELEGPVQENYFLWNFSLQNQYSLNHLIQVHLLQFIRLPFITFPLLQVSLTWEFSQKTFWTSLN